MRRTSCQMLRIRWPASRVRKQTQRPPVLSKSVLFLSRFWKARHMRQGNLPPPKSQIPPFSCLMGRSHPHTTLNHPELSGAWLSAFLFEPPLVVSCIRHRSLQTFCIFAAYGGHLLKIFLLQTCKKQVGTKQGCYIDLLKQNPTHPLRCSTAQVMRCDIPIWHSTRISTSPSSLVIRKMTDAAGNQAPSSPSRRLTAARRSLLRVVSNVEQAQSLAKSPSTITDRKECKI
ncbi:hypothetical protein B0J14DRAFT_302795 [Halenospora varia]|nr:hypothetical protein B0J14DRAFT_302795 [Halenospora varia]